MIGVKRFPLTSDGLLRHRLAGILKILGFYAPFKNTGKFPSAEGHKRKEVVYLEARGESLHISGEGSDYEVIVSLRESNSQIASEILTDFLPIYRQNLAINHDKKDKELGAKK